MLGQFCRGGSILLVALVLALPATAAEWGTLKGRFVYDGKAAPPPKISVNKDPEVCGKHNLVDESLVVGPKGEFSNVLFYLRLKKGDKVDTHPDYEKTAKDKIVVDNKNCRFSPHIQILRTTQSLVLKNSDPVAHNSNLQAVTNPSANVLIPSENEVDQPGFSQDESLPVKVGCNIHPWMGGWLLVRSNPYAAVTDDKGEFKIENLPAGKELEFQLWQEKMGYLKGATIKGATVDKQGRVKIKIKPGDNDLGEIKVKG